MEFFNHLFIPPVDSHFSDYYLATALWIGVIGWVFWYFGSRAKRLSGWLEKDIERLKAKGQALAESTAIQPQPREARLSKDRPMTFITLRVPADVVESMNAIAPKRGFSDYQPLLKAYMTDGLRHDEAKYTSEQSALGK